MTPVTERPLVKRVAVFCGANVGKSPEYCVAAGALGKALSQRNLTVVYGGTKRGVMRSLADAVVDSGGTLHGVVSEALVLKGQCYDRASILDAVETRSLRKSRMAELADAFIALPGGLGTLEEIIEMWVDAQFDGHTKPLGLLNTNGFYNPLMAFLQHMVSEQFLPASHLQMVALSDSPGQLIEAMLSAESIKTEKWI